MICSIRGEVDFNFPKDNKVKEIMLDARVYSVEEMLSFKNSELGVVYDLINIPPNIIMESLADFKMLAQAMTRVKFRVGSIALVRIFSEKGLRVFCYPEFADSLDRLKILIECGSCDVYIGGELGFKMKEVKGLMDRHGAVNTRIMPNMATLAGGFTMVHKGEDENLTAFWVRPDDLKLYEGYVDIIEFFGKEEKQSTFYDIYFNQADWYGDLSEIIAGLGEVNNIGLHSTFGERRLNCGKKCLLDKCHSCFKCKAMADLIKDNNLKITKRES